MPNTVSNHLTTGLLKYIQTTGRYTSGINLFEKLRTRDVEVSSLLARVLIMADEEVRAVRLMFDALQDVPMDYALLDSQAAFCQDKGEGEMALECAKRAVTAAPSEFSTWAQLADVYVKLEQWDLALLTLNSCPMFTYQDRDTPRMPQPSRIMLPILAESILDEIDEGQPRQGDPHDFVHPSLRKLHAAAYQGTFLKAYNILTKIAKSIGWDQLLKIRSEVFVMEEEYRVERQHSTAKPKAHSINDQGSPETNGDGNENGNGNEDGNGDEQEGSGGHEESQASIERPEQTMASEVVKSGNEDVSFFDFFYSSSLACRNRVTDTKGSSMTRRTRTTRSSATNDCASAGWTTCSWCCTKTSGFTQSGARRWPSSASNRWSTRNPRRNGRFWANWQIDCTTLTRPSRHTSSVSRFGSRPRPCAGF